MASFSCVEIGGMLLLGPVLLFVLCFSPLVEIFKGHLLWKTSDFRGIKYLVCKYHSAVGGQLFKIHQCCGAVGDWRRCATMVSRQMEYNHEEGKKDIQEALALNYCKGNSGRH